MPENSGMTNHLISAGADAALKSYLAGRHGVEPSQITLVSLDAQNKAWSDITGTLWDASVGFAYMIEDELHVLEIREAIPPAYTEYIGHQLAQYVRSSPAATTTTRGTK